MAVLALRGVSRGIASLCIGLGGMRHLVFFFITGISGRLILVAVVVVVVVAVVGWVSAILVVCVVVCCKYTFFLTQFLTLLHLSQFRDCINVMFSWYLYCNI